MSTTLGEPTSANLIEHTPSAYQYPLLIKHLLHTPLAHAADQEIVYRDLHRFDYRTLVQRIGRLASGLASLGVKPGNTVAMMDWDSHRYLECFFGVPMMGAVLHTVNIRLSPEQILYTINHAEDDVILVNGEFLPVLEEIKDRIQPVKKLVLLSDGGDRLLPGAAPPPRSSRAQDPAGTALAPGPDCEAHHRAHSPGPPLWL